ncbi:MAG: hypothetical protein K8R87_10450 [Verrucomicrobia bacterium]|nr:hypothetical protein [Verrucomicrobiota bacterium]
MKTLQLITLIAALTFNVQADTLNPTNNSTQAAMLQSQAGKLVELHLRSGEKMSGKVAFVGDSVVHLTALTGMELFEATVSLGDISAVIVRTAK